MTVFLLDAAVLIALIDAQYLFNYDAERWFSAFSAAGRATCATTANAVLRIARDGAGAVHLIDTGE